jgi:hypothetical protein
MPVRVKITASAGPLGGNASGRLFYFGIRYSTLR